MRLLVSHDKHGTISGICVPGEAFGDAIGVHPQPGHSLSVIEVDAATMDGRQLARIAVDFAVHVERARLVRREPVRSLGPMRGGPSHVE